MGIALASLAVHVPKVFTDLSTDRVLVMERLEGVRADDIEAVNGLGLDRSAIVRTVMASLILPAMREGMFHGDMPPATCSRCRTAVLAFSTSAYWVTSTRLAGLLFAISSWQWSIGGSVTWR